MYYAILYNTGEVIADAAGLLECNDQARKITEWSGGVAPYYIAKEKTPGAPTPGVTTLRDIPQRTTRHERS